MAEYDKESAILSIFGHEANPLVLEGILAYLSRKGFSFVSTDDILAMRHGTCSWESRLAWITYDDGWQGMAKLIPVLERYNAPITIFISPKETDRGCAWSKHVKKGMFTTNGISLFEVSANRRYELLDSEIGDKVGNRELADWEELLTVSKHPLVTIANHTNTHLSCSHRPEEEVLDDVFAADAALAQKGVRHNRLMCYPFGHFTEEVDSRLKHNGFIPVRSNPGIMTVDTFGCHRNAFHQWVTIEENIGRVLGAWPQSRFKAF